MRQIDWAERAISDYEFLTEYLFETWGEHIAMRVLSEIDYQLSRIQKVPMQFPVFIRENEIRRCVASPQTSIFFVIRPESVLVLSIFDNRLNPQKHPW